MSCACLSASLLSVPQPRLDFHSMAIEPPSLVCRFELNTECPLDSGRHLSKPLDCATRCSNVIIPRRTLRNTPPPHGAGSTSPRHPPIFFAPTITRSWYSQQACGDLFHERLQNHEVLHVTYYLTRSFRRRNLITVKILFRPLHDYFMAEKCDWEPPDPYGPAEAARVW